MQFQDVIALVIVYALISAVLVISLLYAKKHPEGNIRKIIHIGIGNFVFVWWMFTQWWVMEIFFVIPFAALLLYSMFKADTKNIVGKANSEGSSTGLFFYVVSIGVLVAIFFGHFVAASVGIIAMTYGDSMGSIIGKRYGKHKISNNKSLEGSLAVFAFTALMTFIVIAFYSFLINNGMYSLSSASAIIPIWAICLISGAASSIIEFAAPGNVDNLAVPIGVTIILCLLGM